MVNVKLLCGQPHVRHGNCGDREETPLIYLTLPSSLAAAPGAQLLYQGWSFCLLLGGDSSWQKNVRGPRLPRQTFIDEACCQYLLRDLCRSQGLVLGRDEEELARIRARFELYVMSASR